MLQVNMGCSHCDHEIDQRTEYFELHHHQGGSAPALQHTFCSADCLREQFFGENESR